MADPDYRPPGAFDDVTLGSTLRRGGKVAEDVARQVAYNLEEVNAMMPTSILLNAVKQRLRKRDPNEGASIGPAPFAMPSSNPGVQALAMVADPTNLVGAGLGTKLLGAAAPLVRKLGTKAATTAATEVAEKAAPAAKRTVEGALQNLNLRAMTPEEALLTAERGEHLRKRPSGATKSEGLYYGGPRNITSPAKLGGNRQRLDIELNKAADEIASNLGAERVGDWYPSQRRGVEKIAEPYQRSRLAEAEGLFSSQASPEGELGFSLQAHNRLAREEPVGIVHTGRQGREFEQSAAEGRPINLGEKTSIYAQQSDPSRPPSIFGTNDFRQAQYMGYTEPSGKAQTTGMKPSQHAFMDAETLLLAKRARDKALGGRTDWTGSMAQEVPWVIEKGNAMQKNYPARFPKTPAGRKAALEEGAKTIETHLPKHTAGATYEYVPGASTGHAPTSGKSADYGSIGAWADPANEGRDVIYSGMRMLQQPTKQGRGVYTNAAGEVEFNPVNIAQPMVDFGATKAAGRAVDPATAEMLSLGEHFRGAVDAQEAAAWHIPLEQSTRKASTKTHGLLERGAPLTDEEMRQTVSVLPPGWSASASPRGAMLMNFGEGNTRKAQELIDAMQPKLAAAVPGSKPVQRVGMDSDLVEIYARGGKPTPAGQGIVTSELLQRAARNPGAARNLSESEAVRGAIRAKMLRDKKLAAGGEPIREDIQKLRGFLSEADWAKAADLVRKGMTPAAAVAALGYSLSGMAEEAR